MTENKDRIVEKKVYEEGKKEYASRGVGGTALGLGIAGTALGLIPWLTGSGRSSGIFGNANMPENVNINAYGGASSNTAPTALQVMEKECADELALTNEIWGMKLNTANKFYAMRETDVNEKFSLWKGQVDADFSLYKSQIDADFGLYKNQRDSYDALNEKYASKFNELDKEVAVLKATRPYQDKIIMQAIEMMGERSTNYTDRKTCKCIYGQLVLPSTPTVTGYGSYNACNCNASSTTPSTGA